MAAFIQPLIQSKSKKPVEWKVEKHFDGKKYWTNYHLGVAGDGGAFVVDDPVTHAFLPGDTIFIDSSTASLRTYIYMAELLGAPGNPIVIINYGYVDMYSGIELYNCKYVEVSGQGVTGSAVKNNSCGLVMRGHFTDVIGGDTILYANDGGPAFKFHGKSRNLRIHHVEFTKTKYGMQIKNDENCDTTLNFPNWVIDSVEIDHNYGHKFESQWAYLGSTEPDNAIDSARVVSCSGVNKFFNPGRLGNFKIHDNIIQNTGRGGIQLSTASVGTSRIWNNTIYITGAQRDDAQGGGITLGGYTKAIVDSNNIRCTYTYGIINYGTNIVRIYNNTIDSSGYTYHQLVDTLCFLPWPRNITTETRFTTPVDSTVLWLWNNVMTHASCIDHAVLTYSFALAGSMPSVLNWGYDNRHGGNTYAGVTISAGSTRIENTASAHLVDTTFIITPLVNAERDYVNYYKVTDSDTTLYGSAQALTGRTITSKVWTKISGSGTITSSTSFVTTVTGLSGTSVFRLTVTDSGGKTMYDDMTLYSDGTPSPPPIGSSDLRSKLYTKKIIVH